MAMLIIVSAEDLLEQLLRFPLEPPLASSEFMFQQRDFGIMIPSQKTTLVDR